MACILKKSLYGLKQTPRQWYKRFNRFMSDNGYTRCQANPYYYMKRNENCYIILLIYVDDMLIARPNMEKIKDINEQLSY